MGKINWNDDAFTELFNSTLETNSEDASDTELMVKGTSIQAPEVNLNGRTVADVLNIRSSKEKFRYSHCSIEHLSVEGEIFDDALASWPNLHDLNEEGLKIVTTFEYFLKDVFLSLYLYNAKVIPKENLHMSCMLNRSVLERIINTKEFFDLKRCCRFDALYSAVGTIALGKEAIPIFQELIDQLLATQQQKDEYDKLVEQEQQIDDLVQELDDFDDLIEQMEEDDIVDQDDIDAAEAQREQVMQQIENLQQQADQTASSNALQGMTNASDNQQIQNQIKIKFNQKVLEQAFENGSTEIQEIEQCLSACGGTENGGGVRIPFSEAKCALERVRKNKSWKKLVDLIGKFQESAVAVQKSKAKNGAVEISSVTTGNAIQDSLPSERAMLCNDTTKRTVYQKMTENRLMTYKKKNSSKNSKGPIIVCVDTSGSMEGSSELWSKALTVSVLEIAQMQKRDFACIIYSSSAEEPIIIGKNEISPTKVLDCAEKFLSGGTDFQSPLEKSLELLKGSQFKDGDILFITDGESRVDEKFINSFNRKKEDMGFSVKGVLVNLGRGSNPNDTTLSKFCDDITPVSDIADLTDANGAANRAIFGSL